MANFMELFDEDPVEYLERRQKFIEKNKTPKELETKSFVSDVEEE